LFEESGYVDLPRFLVVVKFPRFVVIIASIAIMIHLLKTIAMEYSL